jgi:hypothetical protein
MRRFILWAAWVPVALAVSVIIDQDAIEKHQHLKRQSVSFPSLYSVFLECTKLDPSLSKASTSLLLTRSIHGFVRIP